MAVTVTANGQDTANLFGATKTVTLPTNASGELMFIACAHRTDHVSIPTPSGWTLIGRFDDSGANIGRPAMTVFRKVSAGSETTVVIGSGSAELELGIQMVVVSGQDTTTPIQATTSTSAGEVYFARPAPWEDVAGTADGMLLAFTGSSRANITGAAVASYGTRLAQAAGPAAKVDLDVTYHAIASTGTKTGGTLTESTNDFTAKSLSVSIAPVASAPSTLLSVGFFSI